MAEQQMPDHRHKKRKRGISVPVAEGKTPGVDPRFNTRRTRGAHLSKEVPVATDTKRRIPAEPPKAPVPDALHTVPREPERHLPDAEPTANDAAASTTTKEPRRVWPFGSGGQVSDDADGGDD